MALSPSQLTLSDAPCYPERRMVRHGTPDHVSQFEVVPDRHVVAGAWPLVRLCGADFEEFLARPELGFQKPFDARFGKLMVKTAAFVLTRPDLDCAYAYVEHDEISILLRRSQVDLSAHHLLCRAVGVASAKLTLLCGDVVTFQGHVYEFPQPGLVLGYFRWRQHEWVRRALDGHCAYALMQAGADADGVGKLLSGMGPDEKVEILHNNGIDYSLLPLWQRRGTGIVVRADGIPGDAGRLIIDTDLPEEEAYATYLRPLIT